MYGDIEFPVRGQFVIAADEGYVTGRIYGFTSGEAYKLVHQRPNDLAMLVDYDFDEPLLEMPYDCLGSDTSELTDSSLNTAISEQLDDVKPAAKTATIDLLSLYTKRAKTSSITADIKETADGAADLQRISEDRSTRKLRKRYGADLV